MEATATMSAITDAIANLTTKVTNLTTVEQSAVTLLQGLSAQIRENVTAPAQLQTLADQIDTSANDLAAAVAANT